MNPMCGNKKSFNLVLKIVLVLFLGFLVTYVYFRNPSLGPILPCLFNKSTGYKCPGCGMTRVVNSFMHLEIKEAFKYNKLIFIAPLWIGFRNKFNSKYIDGGFIIISILYGIARNMV